MALERHELIYDIAIVDLGWWQLKLRFKLVLDFLESNYTLSQKKTPVRNALTGVFMISFTYSTVTLFAKFLG